MGREYIGRRIMLGFVVFILALAIFLAWVVLTPTPTGVSLDHGAAVASNAKTNTVLEKPASILDNPNRYEACRQGAVAVFLSNEYGYETKIADGNLWAIPWAFTVCRKASRAEIEIEIAKIFSDFVLREQEATYFAGERIHLNKAHSLLDADKLCTREFPKCVVGWEVIMERLPGEVDL